MKHQITNPFSFNQVKFKIHKTNNNKYDISRAAAVECNEYLIRWSPQFKPEFDTFGTAEVTFFV